MRPKRTTSRARLDLLVTTLKEDINSGKRLEGEFLPSESELGEMYSLSKNTVRKGLNLLVGEGYIEKLPRIGTRIIRKKQKTGTVIRFGHYASLDREVQLLQLIKQFNESNPDIFVEPVPLAYPKEHDATQKYLQDGTVFDIMTVNSYNFNFMRSVSPEKSVLEPLESDEGYYPFLNTPFQSGSHQYVLPFVFTPVILVYNKEHFREAGISEPDSGWTWDDLSEAATKLSYGKERLGFYFHLLSENRWPIFLLQNGVRFERDPSGRYNMRDPKVIEAFETCMSIVNKHFTGYLSENDSDIVSLFLQGKVSIIMATYSNLNLLKSAKFEYDIAPVPHLKELRTLLVVIGFAINKSSEHKEAALRFVKYMLSYETQMKIRQNTLNLPSLKRAAEWVGEEQVENRPYRFHMYRELIHTFRLYSDLNLSPRELALIRNEMRYYWSGMEDLDTVLKRLEESM